jgi:hypothetical protein
MKLSQIFVMKKKFIDNGEAKEDKSINNIQFWEKYLKMKKKKDS